MTVRVNKPAFNIREKLSELERPIGVKGHELMGAETAQEARDRVSAGRKNLVINGDLRIWQRTTSATINTSKNAKHQTADRWNNYHNSSGSVTESRSTDVPDGAGFYYSLKHEVATADTSIATGDYHCHKYDIEGYDVAHLMWGTPHAKTITVSFWVKSSVVGDYGFNLRPGSNNTRVYVDTIRVDEANTWKKYSFTIPGCPDGTWVKENTSGLQIQINHMMGTEYQTSDLKQWISLLDVSPPTQVNWMATVGNTWYITGLQLEVGENATEFEHRSYGEELALCQRYYWKTEDYYWLYHVGSQHGYVRCPVFYPVEMREDPTVTISGFSGSTGTGNGVQAVNKKSSIFYVNTPGTNLVSLDTGTQFLAEI